MLVEVPSELEKTCTSLPAAAGGISIARDTLGPESSEGLLSIPPRGSIRASEILHQVDLRGMSQEERLNRLRQAGGGDARDRLNSGAGFGVKTMWDKAADE